MINEGGGVSMLHQVTKKEGVVGHLSGVDWAFKCHFPDFSDSPLLKGILSTGYFAVVFHHS